MEQGREVGAYARSLFPGGVLVDGYGEQTHTNTRRLIADDNTNIIFEANFTAGGYTTRADILTRNGDGWDVLEVKSSFADSKKVGNEYVDDLAYTIMVLRQAGMNVKASALVLLSREYRHGNPVDRLFTRVDRTDQVDTRMEEFAADAETFADAVLAEHAPEPRLNRACKDCDFFKTVCLGSGHAHTVLELPGLRQPKLERLSAVGAIDIADIPAELELNEIQQRAKAAAESDQVFVSQTLGETLAAIEWPCHYLDFETVATTMPLYPEHGCYRQVITQFSVHRRDNLDDTPRHNEFLANAAQCEEHRMAERLIEVLGTRGAIIVYGNFEDIRIKALIGELPELAAPLQAIRGRIVNFQKIIKENVYHPAFAGSFSLKTVVPALVLDVGYDGLAVADGDNAIAVFARMARGEIDDVAAARRQLLAYCKTDTLVMVRLHEILAAMAA